MSLNNLTDLLTNYQDFKNRQIALSGNKERLQLQSFVNDCEVLLAGYLPELSPGNALIGENGDFVLPVSYANTSGYVIISTDKATLQFGTKEISSKLSQKYPFTPLEFSDRQIAAFLLSIQKTAQETTRIST